MIFVCRKKNIKEGRNRALIEFWGAPFLSPRDKQKNKRIQLYIPNNNQNKKRQYKSNSWRATLNPIWNIHQPRKLTLTPEPVDTKF